MYRVVDRHFGHLMLLTSDPRTLIRFILDCVMYDVKRHSISFNRETVSLRKILRLKRELARQSGKSIRSGHAVRTQVYSDTGVTYNCAA